MFQCAFLFSAFLDFSTREKISDRSLVFISTHTYCSDAGRILLKCAQILPQGFDLETVAHACVALLFSVEQNCSRAHGSLKLPTLPHAFSITLLLHRKRESQRHVSGYKTLRSRLPSRFGIVITLASARARLEPT